MDNWIGVAIWVLMGGLIGLAMKIVVKRPHDSPGHSAVLFTLGGFAGAIGGMLGVGIFEFYNPVALSPGGMASAAVFAALMTWVYRWGIKGLT